MREGWRFQQTTEVKAESRSEMGAGQKSAESSCDPVGTRVCDYVRVSYPVLRLLSLGKDWCGKRGPAGVDGSMDDGPSLIACIPYTIKIPAVPLVGRYGWREG